MDVDQLVAFERVVREGSFSKAAWSLGLAQPTVSARIQALEREVGGTLFNRTRQVTLTERGVSFLPYVRRALALLQDGMEVARRAGTGERGRLAIGALRSLSGNFLGPLLAQFHQQYPEVECCVREGEHWQLVEMLCDGVIEIALICWPCLDPLLADMTPVIHLREPVVFVVPRYHPLSHRTGVMQEEMLAQSHLFLLLRWWQAAPNPIAHLTAQAASVADVPMDTGRFLLRSGVGVGFFAKMMILPEIQENQVIEIPVLNLPPIYRDIALVHLTRHCVLSSTAINFIHLLERETQKQEVLTVVLNRIQMYSPNR